MAPAAGQVHTGPASQGRFAQTPVVEIAAARAYYISQRVPDPHANRTPLREDARRALCGAAFPARRQRDPHPRRARDLRGARHRGAVRLEPDGGRYSRPEISAPDRRSRGAEEGEGSRRSGVPAAFRARCRRARQDAGRSALRRRDQRPPDLRPHRRGLGLLGLEGRLFRPRRGRRPRLRRRDEIHARRPDRRAEQPAMVQHRPALGLWHRGRRAGPLLCRPRDRRAFAIGERL
jgi:hypothetical protein